MIIKRKLRSLVLGVFIFTLIFGQTIEVAAAPRVNVLGVLSYWESNEASIGHWNASSLSYRLDKLNTNANFPYTLSMNYAFSQWQSALGINIYATTSSSSTMRSYGGTFEEICAMGVNLQQGYGGMTSYSCSNEGSYNYNSSLKTSYVMTSATVYIVDKDRSDNAHKNVSMHEVGHSLGWLGHSPNSSDVMYERVTQVAALSTRDSRHLAQVY